MAVTQIYTAVPNDVITAARWNNEFGNIYNNGTAIAFPATSNISLQGFTLTLDSSGVTTLSSAATIGFSLTPGSKSGTPGTTGSQLNVVAHTFTDSNTAGSGTAAAYSGVSLQRPTVAAVNSAVTVTDAATLYIANSPVAGTNVTITNPYAIWVDNGAVRFDGLLETTTLKGTSALGGYIQGLTYAPAADVTNDVTIAVGMATSDNTAQTDRLTIVLTSALTKQIDAAWSVGTNQGGLDTGAVGNNDYYIWLIMRPDTGVVDALFSLSSTSPTMPTSYTFKRLIGWIKRETAANVPFLTYELSGGGLDFTYVTSRGDVDLANTLTTSRRTDALSVPLTFSTIAKVRLGIVDAAAVIAIVQNPDEADAAPSATVAPGSTIRTDVAGVSSWSDYNIRTSATGTIASRSGTATADGYDVVTYGFMWSRR